MFGQLSSITLWRRAELVARPRHKRNHACKAVLGGLASYAAPELDARSSPASRGWSATLTCPMRGACDRWVMSRPRAVAPHLDLSLNTYAGLGRPHRAVLTCLTMSGSFRRVLVTITVTRARVRASKSALPAAHLMQGRCVPCRTGWTQGRAGNTCRLSLPAPARHGRGCGTRANFPGADLVNVSADGRFGRSGPPRDGTGWSGRPGTGRTTPPPPARPAPLVLKPPCSCSHAPSLPPGPVTALRMSVPSPNITMNRNRARPF